MKPILRINLATAAMAALFAVSVFACTAEFSPARTVELLCEGMRNPLGIDTQPPSFSWSMEDDRRGAKQTAWRILAALSVESLQAEDSLLWDSGKMMSDQSQWVTWEGPKLASRQRVYWKVMIWDADHRPTDWSQPAWFEMGLLKPSDWQALWIQGPETALQVEGEAMEFWFRHLFLDGPRNSFKFGDETAGGRIAEAENIVLTRTHPATIFRREFTLATSPRQARLYISGLGYHEVSINAHEVDIGRGVPSWTHYPLGAYYQTLDVSDLLEKGPNAIAVTVALGRYKETWGVPYSERPCLMAQLDVELTDGTHLVIGTDPGWRMTADGPLVGSQFLMFDVYDARREVDFSMPAFDDGGWTQAAVMPEPPAAKLNCEIVPPTRALETIEPVSARSLAPGVTLIDFGRMISGHVRLRIKGAPSGTPVMIRYYEAVWPWGNDIPDSLPNDERNEWISFTTFPHYESYDGPVQKGMPIMRRRGSGVPVRRQASIVQSDTYITAGDHEESWEAPFNCNAFKYAEILTPHGLEAEVEAVAVVTHVDIPCLSAFETSSALYKQIWQAGLKTGLYNLQDGTTLDNLAYERGSFLHISSANHGNMMNFDMQAIQRRQIMEIRRWHEAGMNDGKPIATQVQGSRFVDFHKVPIERVSMSEARFWVELPYYHYLYYGDPRVPLAMRTVSERFLHFWTEDPAVMESGGMIFPDPWGDHVDFTTQYDITPEVLRYLMPPELYHAVTLAQLLGEYNTLAGTLGFEGEPEARLFAAKWVEVRDSINARYFNSEKGAYCTEGVETLQGSNALPLACGIAPEGTERSIVDAIVGDIENWNGHQSTGWRTTHELFDVLSHHGRIDIAAGLMSRTAYPSFGKMLAGGFGTLHEYWGLPNSPQPARGTLMQNEGNTAACGWFSRSLAGIRPTFEGPGFKHFIVAPQLPSDLDHAEYRYRSPYGNIISGWRKEGNMARFTIEIPPNTTATVYIPGQQVFEGEKEGPGSIKDSEGVQFIRAEEGRMVFEVQSGRYHFTSALSQ